MALAKAAARTMLQPTTADWVAAVLTARRTFVKLALGADRACPVGAAVSPAQQTRLRTDSVASKDAPPALRSRFDTNGTDLKLQHGNSQDCGAARSQHLG